MYSHPANCFGDAADEYIAAACHNGNNHSELVRHYALDLSFDYLCATSKEEYLRNIDKFISPKIGEKSILFETITISQGESDALKMISSLKQDSKTVKQIVKDIMPESVKKIVSKFLINESRYFDISLFL